MSDGASSDSASTAGTADWYLYLIETAGGALYTGITTDVTRRLAEHRAGRGAKALRGRGPLRLVHHEPVGSRGAALRLEAKIKRLPAARKRAWLMARQPPGAEGQQGESMHPILDDIELVAFDLDGTLIDSVPDLALAVDAALADLGLPAAGEAKVRDWVGNGSLKLMERALRHAAGSGSGFGFGAGAGAGAGEADPSTGLRGGAVNPSLGATDAIPGIGPPLRPVPGVSPDSTAEGSASPDGAVEDSAASEAPDSGLLERAHAGFLKHYARDPGAHTRLYPGVRECLDGLRRRGVTLALVTNKPHAFIAPLLEGLGLAEHFALCLGGDSLPEKKPDPAPLRHVAAHFGVAPEACLMVGDSRHDIAAGKAAGFRTLAVPYGYNHGEPVSASEPDAILASLDALLTAPAASLPR